MVNIANQQYEKKTQWCGNKRNNNKNNEKRRRKPHASTIDIHKIK